MSGHREVAAYLSPEGIVRALPDIAPPVAVNPAGTLVAGSRAGGPHPSSGYDLIEESLPTGTVEEELGRTGSQVPRLTVHNFTGDGRVLLDSLGSSAVWQWDPNARTVKRSIVLAPNDELLGAAPGGGYFALSGTDLVRLRASGVTQWRLLDRNGGQRPMLSPAGPSSSRRPSRRTGCRLSMRALAGAEGPWPPCRWARRTTGCARRSGSTTRRC